MRVTPFPTFLSKGVMLLHSPRCPVHTSPNARVSNTSTRRRFIGMYPKYTTPLVLISFKWHAPTWGKIRVIFKLLLWEEAVPMLKQIRCVPPGYRSLAALRSCSRARWPVRKPLAGTHLYRGGCRTVLGDQAVTECNSVTVFKSH